MAQLQGNQISQTFQKLIQIDSSVPVTGNYVFDMNSAINTSNYTLLNGQGKKHVGIVIDQSGESDGGVFIKNVNLYGFQNRGNELRFVKNNNEQLAFLRNTGTFHIGEQSVNDIPDYNLYVDRGIFIQGPGKFNVSDGSTTTDNGRLNISANNDTNNLNTPEGFNDYLNNVSNKGKNYDIFKSGKYDKDGVVLLWQRSGSVVSCNGYIDHNQVINNEFRLPLYISDINLNKQFESNSYDGIVGHGTNTYYKEIVIRNLGDDKFEVCYFFNTILQNIITQGESYFSFSYRFVE